MVGTLEPRKGHGFVLDAFEQLWMKGINCRLCIIGKIGWNIEDVERRIRTHPELSKRLLFIEDPSDAEIERFYGSATALVMASISEGFGLPIIEAAIHQVPSVLSDIPVFREIGGEGSIYFSLESPGNLVNAVKNVIEMSPQNRQGMAKKIVALTWRESAARILEIITGEYKFALYSF
jgi:hypothetical protein